MTDGPQEGEGDSLWNRLRRRKVVQWGVAYAAGSWVLLQVLGFTADAFEWPAITKRLAMLALVLGLPIVFVLAWYHGDRGQQRVIRAELATLTLLLLLGGGILWLYGQRDTQVAATSAPPAAPTAAQGSPAASADERPSIAVLPFENRSAKQDDAFFVDGIHDDILTQLSKVSALKVISRTSVEQFRDTKLPTKTIAEQLSVKSILEGGVQRAGERVRINVQLIDAGTDAHLWAESYDRDLTAANIFAIQSEVAAAISGALKATLTPDEKTRLDAVPTRSLEAWEAYQLGKRRMANRTSAGLAEAEKYFRDAIDVDPRFALAYVGLADTLALQVQYSGALPAAGLARAEAAAARALELDPNLAEAWVSAAFVAVERQQYDRAEPMFRRAIALNPNYATAQHWFSDMLGIQGRGDEALDHAWRAAGLDPLSAIINYNLGSQLELGGHFEEAETRYRKLIEIDPLMPAGYVGVGLVRAYARDRFADAIQLVGKAAELDPGNPRIQCWLALLYLDLGSDREANRIIEIARERWPNHPFVLGVATAVHKHRGDEEATARLSRRAFDSDPKDLNSMFFIGDASLQDGDYEVARARYNKAYPDLLAPAPPKIDASNYFAAINLVPILQETGEIERAKWLLDRSEEVIRTLPRLGGGAYQGYQVGDARIIALRGGRTAALDALREAAKAGWRGPIWRYYRDFDPALDSIRDEPEFKAIFADIERDMARQRAELAKLPKDAPLDLAPTP